MRMSRLAPILIPATSGALWPSGLSPYCWYDAVQKNQAVVSQWDDFSGNSRNMTLTNFSGTASDGWNTSPDFLRCDGVDSRGRYNNASLNAASTDISFVTAIKTVATANGWQYGLSNEGTNQCLGMYYYVQSMAYQVGSYDVSGTSKTLTLSGVNGTAWHIIGVTYSQATKVTAVYVDGIYFGSTAAHATGIAAINRHSIAENYYGGAKQCDVGFSGIFAGTALTAQNHEDIYNLNCLRFGLSKI